MPVRFLVQREFRDLVSCCVLCREGFGVDSGLPGGLLWGRTVRCARAVRKVGCFSPPVATDPKALNSAPCHPPAAPATGPYSPCWYTRDFLF